MTSRKDPVSKRIGPILDILAKTYPDATIALHFKNPYQLLVATILSAQCTDERVNKVTPDFFKRYPDPKALAAAPREDIEEAIRSTGFYRNKARALQESAQALLDRHKGRIPNTMEDMVKLPGVGRKTANVILGTAMELESGIVVDTHVKRVSGRLKLTEQADPEKIEQDLMKIIPKGRWIAFGHQMILHGRRICIARKPKCPECPLADLCPEAVEWL
jgi:endonuclease-3